MDKRLIICDFDETLYHKDSLITFHLFCVRRNPLLLCWLPLQVTCYLLHTLNFISTQQFKNSYLLFLAFHSETSIRKKAAQFWNEQFPRHFNTALITSISNSTEELVVITASPVVYLEPLLNKLPPLTLIGTNLSKKAGFWFIDGKNCKGPEKVVRLKQHFGSGFVVTKSYSDSLTDAPILDLAEQAFMVKGDLITPYRR